MEKVLITMFETLYPYVCMYVCMYVWMYVCTRLTPKQFIMEGGQFNSPSFIFKKERCNSLTILPLGGLLYGN